MGAVVRKSVRRLADDREIIYYDDTPGTPDRAARDTRDLPAQAPRSEIRRDPLTGDWVVLATHRQTRTYHPPADLCPLCPSTPERPTEIPEAGYDVVVFENRFPSFARQVPDTPPTVEGMPMVQVAPARGRTEVVCFTQDHDSSFGQLRPERVRTVLDVWADRTVELGKQPGVVQVYPFENRGTEIGVTLSHPHGQIYAYPFVTPRTELMLATAAEYQARHGRPVLGDVLASELATGRRVLATNEQWTAYVPAAARWPVEVHVVPHRQVPDLPSLDDAARDAFADVYLRVLHMLDALYDRPLPYVAGWHQAPVRVGRDLAWLRLELFSVLRAADRLKYLAGSESGMAVWINDVRPEELADRLRANDPASAY